MEFEIKHDIENQKFFTIIDGNEAYLKYIVTSPNLIETVKTFVPPELRGKGIAGKIVKEGLLFAQRNNYKVIPSCSYVEDFILRHPEFDELRYNN